MHSPKLSLVNRCATMTLLIAAASASSAFAQTNTAPAARPKVLFLTHSAGFVHDVVKRSAPNELALAEREFIALAKERYEVIPTQDCADLNPARLAQVAAVAFYTTGELPLTPQNRDAFIAWVKNGGAFVGMHCASDTFYEYAPYQRMLGGVFNGHPWHQEVSVEVVDASHPATKMLESGLKITDEIYQFKDWDSLPLRELLRIGNSSIDVSKGARDDGNYAVAWCRDYGEGRVFYTSLGHRPEVWMDPRFRQHLLGGLDWAVSDVDWRGAPPAGAIVLLGAKADSGAWTQRDGKPAAWTLASDGTLEVAAGKGDLRTKQEFGDARFHVEFAVPRESGEGEARGNSGVYLMGRYELQVLDSYAKDSGVGDCAAIYGQRAPAVNACKQPTAWQSFDIRWRAPRIGADGKKRANARISVWHNGILVHDDVELATATPGGLSDQEVSAGPLLLQEHGHAVRYRNIWLRAE